MRAEDHYGSTGGRGHHTGYHEDDAVRFSFIQDNVLITQNDTWEVINAFFSENGLVSQQVNSFNHFLFNTIQDIVEEVGRIVIKPERQYKPGDKRFFGMAAIIRWSDLRAEVRAAARLPEAHL
jgi:hypothetical protein